VSPFVIASPFLYCESFSHDGAFGDQFILFQFQGQFCVRIVYLGEYCKCRYRPYFIIIISFISDIKTIQHDLIESHLTFAWPKSSVSSHVPSQAPANAFEQSLHLYGFFLQCETLNDIPYTDTFFSFWQWVKCEYFCCLFWMMFCSPLKKDVADCLLFWVV